MVEKYEKEKERALKSEEDSKTFDNEDDFETEELEKVDKLGTKYNPILPVSDWDLICRECYVELESIIKLREDLIATENYLKAKVFNFI